MRSLTSKLILAFLIVSMISIAGLAALTHFATNREFDRFITDQYRVRLAGEISDYYKQHNGWDDISANPNEILLDAPGPGHEPPPFFAIADPQGIIVFGDPHHDQGSQVDKQYLTQSTPIQVNGETVGYLLLATPPDTHDPVQSQFLDRLDFSLLVGASSAIALALIFGIILSRNISNPIHELTDATRAMAEGKLGQRVVVRSRDEVGRLAESFNKMNADLARSLDLRRQMTADIAHELRTPLSLIIAQAEAVHDGVLPPTRENFDVIREEADRLEKLVEDLRMLSLADAGELSMNLRPTDVNQLLLDIANRHRAEFTKKHVSLDLEPAPVMLQANLDRSRFSQVLGNILENALQYTPSNGRVLIATRAAAGQIEIAIEDSGSGVAPEDAERLFERFYRADEARTRNDGGSGLGLAIAKSIVELHGGKIRAERADSRGLRVVIVLPRAG